MRARRGAALLVVLALMAFVGVLGASATLHAHRVRGMILDTELEVRAGALAEAGLARGLWALRKDPAYRGEGPVPLGAGTYRVDVILEGGRRVLVGIGEARSRGRAKTVSRRAFLT